MTSSTVSSESAPRSSTNDAFGVTSSSFTPSCSTTIFLTRSSIVLICLDTSRWGIRAADSVRHGDARGPEKEAALYRGGRSGARGEAEQGVGRLLTRPQARQAMYMPPLTCSVSPVMYAAAGDA